DGTKPWSFPDVYEQCQEVAKLRMQLLPYLYSSFAQYYLTGVPVFRAMNLVEGYSSEVKRIKTKLDGTDNPYEMAKYYEIKDQYMMGDNILVAPIFAGQTQRNVVLPKGKWYDFYSGELVGEDQVITIEAPEDRIPLYVRDGGIIPMIPQINNTQQWVAGQPLQVRIYGSRESTFDLYDDDGESFDYEKGEYTIKRLSTQKSITDIATRGEWSYTDVQWVEM
ncbi:MAG: glycoside hydrolase family 31 protein, partial [Rikenellaceae bacterium]